MNKVIKKAVAKTPVKKTVAKKAVMKKGGTKKPLKKAQTGQTVTTPFQSYLKNNPGAVPSDTIATIGGKRADALNTQVYSGAGIDTPKAKNPKNQANLAKAFAKTYGQDYNRGIGSSGDSKETEEQFRRRMGSTYKKGGATKKAKGFAVKSKKK
jgi:hypothetical protein